ncbi:hypothetical protein HY404_03115 [Candidatus Microgenomates bacterium]|nr:hypothetical protein [Candidatus Microgenomates bacterium]
MHREIIKQILTLSTSGFGLVAALAWNNVIQEFVNQYIKQWLPGDKSGIISLLVYALTVTILAVVITIQLSQLSEKLKSKEQKKKKR